MSDFSGGERESMAQANAAGPKNRNEPKRIADRTYGLRVVLFGLFGSRYQDCVASRVTVADLKHVRRSRTVQLRS